MRRKAKSAGRILLVDDQEALAGIRVAFLEQEGFEVVWACDGEQARQRLATEFFHLVVTDAVLPGRSGWEVASDARKRGLPVILSSGWPVRLRSHELAARGVDYLCPKPCRLGDLHAVIRTALQKGRRRDARHRLVPKSQYQSHR